MAIVLESDVARATVLPDSGGRVQHLLDRRSGRELLYVRRGGDGTDFGSATTGGWDVLFPNDEAWRGHPDHGRAWNAAFTVEEADRSGCRLSLSLDAPRARLTRTFNLLDPPRAGLREELRVHAEGDVGPCLIAPHPALAAETGWRIELPAQAGHITADRDYPGRFRPEETLGEQGWASASIVPDTQPSVVEVLYVEGVSEGAIVSTDGRSRTRVRWDPRSLPHLWICVLTGVYEGPPAMVLLEPATSRPYRLDEAIADGQFASLQAGDRWEAEVEMESLDAVA
jgi:hypothetical protein